MPKDFITDELRVGKNPTYRLPTFRGSKLSVVVDTPDNPANAMFMQFEDSINGPTTTNYKARGTVDVPVEPNANDHVSGWVGYAFSGGTWFDVGTIFHQITGAVTPGQRPGARFEFHTTVENSFPTCSMAIMDDKKTGIGFFDPNTGLVPITLLHVAGNDDAAATVQRSGANADGGRFIGRKSRGSVAVPASVQNGDEVAAFRGEAFTNTWHPDLGGIRVVVAAAPVAGQAPATQVEFWVNENNTAAINPMAIAANANGTVRIGNPGTEATRRLHVIGASTSAPLKAQNNNGGANAGVLSLQGGDNSITGSNFVFMTRPDGTAIGSIQQNGAGSVAYNTTSDGRLKEGVTDLTGALGVVAAMRPRRFRFIGSPAIQTGFIAQELAAVLPEVVSQGIQAEPVEGGARRDIWGVDYGKITPVLAAAIKELAARVAVLEGGA